MNKQTLKNLKINLNVQVISETNKNYYLATDPSLFPNSKSLKPCVTCTLLERNLITNIFFYVHSTEK